MKTTTAWVVFGILVVGGMIAFSAPRPEAAPQRDTASHKDAEYVIEGVSVRLQNGQHEAPTTSGSATSVVTRYFGNELKKDLNDDGKEDVIFLLTQTRGGSGTFFYAVAALRTDTGYRGSHGILLGDRIAPQSTVSGPGKSAIVTYADRKSGESFSVPPSVAKSIRVILDLATMQFGEVAQEFEGEADPSRMTLQMKKWEWVRATYNDGRELAPRGVKAFTLTFMKDGRFTATTDCNGMSGSYSVKDTKLTFSAIAMTKMYCEGSREMDFLTLLEKAGSYHFTSRGELVFDLAMDSGVAVFR